jgi:hypothetical protein
MKKDNIIIYIIILIILNFTFAINILININLVNNFQTNKEKKLIHTIDSLKVIINTQDKTINWLKENSL